MSYCKSDSNKKKRKILIFKINQQKFEAKRKKSPQMKKERQHKYEEKKYNIKKTIKI